MSTLPPLGRFSALPYRPTGPEARAGSRPGSGTPSAQVRADRARPSREAGASSDPRPGAPGGPSPVRAWPTPLEELLKRLRLARFRDGVRCPRCSCARVQRWGCFSGRQRYRCTGCRRTFSDLTGTPAAYIKKLELWPAYGRGMEEAESLRAAARRLGIHPSTAFRWRHRLLEGLRARDREALSGWIECCLLGGYAESHKGCRRGLDRPPRTHAVVRPWSVFPHPGARGVLVAADRQGRVVTGLVRQRVPRAADLERILGPHVQAGPRASPVPDGIPDGVPDSVPGGDAGRPSRDHGSPFLADHRRSRPRRRGVRSDRAPTPFLDAHLAVARTTLLDASLDAGPVLVVARAARALRGYVVFAHSRGGTVRSAWSGHPLADTARARAYWRRLQRWMVRFYGVATRYLPNYLVWHRWLDRAHRHASADSIFRWAVTPPPS